MKAQNKVVVVTGAGNGIGRELVLCLLSRGAKVAGVDLNPDTLEETARLASGFENRFCGLVADISDRAAVQTLPEQVAAHFGAIDGLINNAGIIQPFIGLNELEYRVIERVINVNLLGTLYVTKTFLPHLLTRPEAHLANLSSMGGLVPVPGQTVYCAAKAAVKLMTEGLASELHNTKIRFTVVFPGAISTDIASNSGANTGARVNASGNGTRSMTAMPAARAAMIIVNGIDRNAYHVFVGKDASMMDTLGRLNPAFAARLMGKMMRLSKLVD